MNILEYFLVALAASTLADCLLHGEIFATFRALLQAKADDGKSDGQVPEPADDPDWQDVPVPWWFNFADRVIPTFFAKAWTCPYCVQFHAAACMLLMWMLAWLLPTQYMWTLRAPVIWLAVVRLVYLGDAYLPADRRFDRADDEATDDLGDQDEQPVANGS